MRNVDESDVILDKNQPIMDDVVGLMPFQRISEEMKENGAFPGEI